MYTVKVRRTCVEEAIIFGQIDNESLEYTSMPVNSK